MGFFQLFVENINNKFLNKSEEKSSLWSSAMIYNGEDRNSAKVGAAKYPWEFSSLSGRV